MSSQVGAGGCGGELWSAPHGEGAGPQLAAVGDPLKRAERGGLCGRKQSLSPIPWLM